MGSGSVSERFFFSVLLVSSSRSLNKYRKKTFQKISKNEFQGRLNFRVHVKNKWHVRN